MPRDYRQPRYQPERDAVDLLRQKYPAKALALDLVSEVSFSADYGPAPLTRWHASGPDAAHITAALTLLDPVRRHVDVAELHLIAHALARGATWAAIAAALGYDQAAAAAQRYARLRADCPGYRPPRPGAARWAADHETGLRAAVTDVVAHREAVTAEGLIRGTMVSFDDLADLAAAGDPAALYWAAYAATHSEFIWGQPTQAGQVVAALQDLVTEPPGETPGPGRRARRDRPASQ